jgi:hypothetical protein
MFCDGILELMAVFVDDVLTCTNDIIEFVQQLVQKFNEYRTHHV